jgi:hypothetical protein
MIIDREKLNQEFKDKLAAMTDEELIAAFNREVGCFGSGMARMNWLGFMLEEFDRRGYDYSAVGNRKKGISFMRKVRLEGKRFVVTEVGEGKRVIFC